MQSGQARFRKRVLRCTYLHLHTGKCALWCTCLCLYKCLLRYTFLPLCFQCAKVCIPVHKCTYKSMCLGVPYTNKCLGVSEGIANHEGKLFQDTLQRTKADAKHPSIFAPWTTQTRNKHENQFPDFDMEGYCRPWPCNLCEPPVFPTQRISAFTEGAQSRAQFSSGDRSKTLFNGGWQWEKVAVVFSLRNQNWCHCSAWF